MAILPHIQPLLRISIAAVIALEATAAGAAVLGANGGGLVPAAELSQGFATAYAIWMLNAALAVLRRGGTVLVLGLTAGVVAAGTLAGLPGAIGPAALGCALALAMIVYGLRPAFAASPVTFSSKRGEEEAGSPAFASSRVPAVHVVPRRYTRFAASTPRPRGVAAR